MTSAHSFLVIHYWPAFWTVVCLGVIQTVATYYSSVLSVQSLPSHVSVAQRRKHHRALASIFTTFVCLTLVLAKLNDSNQYKSELTVQKERAKQEALQDELRRTFDTVVDSQMKLAQIKTAVDAHPPGAERTGMLQSLTAIQRNLQQQQSSMTSFPH